jgi:uncharacterized protein (TIGR02271 family)
VQHPNRAVDRAAAFNEREDSAMERKTTEREVTTNQNTGRDSNPDPITKAPGSHPVATGVGAAAAGAAGAAIGSIVPGIGTAIGGAVGAVIGAVSGGVAGHAVGEAIDPTETDAYWRDNYKTRNYVEKETDYDRYRPAYLYGANLADRCETSQYDEKLARTGWESSDAGKQLDYDRAKGAIQDEFNRRMKLREERLNVNKERVSAGEVGIHKEVVTERKTIEVPVEREEVVITRHATAQPGRDAGPIRDEQIRVPVSEERVNVSKDTVVTGEVDVSKRKVTETRTVSDDLKKEEVRVDKTGNARVDDRTKNKA